MKNEIISSKKFWWEIDEYIYKSSNDLLFKTNKKPEVTFNEKVLCIK